jgi:LemA protein
MERIMQHKFLLIIYALFVTIDSLNFHGEPKAEKGIMKKTIFTVSGLFILIFIIGCGYNTLRAKEGKATRMWEDVELSSKERLLLVDSYLNIVQKYAPKEGKVLREVEAAVRNAADAGIPIIPPNSQQKLERFRNAQAELTRALAQIMVIEREYPKLMADSSFVAVHKQLETVESRINRAIINYNTASHDFNISKNTFPNFMANALLFRYNDKEPFSAGEKVKLVIDRTS